MACVQWLGGFGFRGKTQRVSPRPWVDIHTSAAAGPKKTASLIEKEILKVRISKEGIVSISNFLIQIAAILSFVILRFTVFARPLESPVKILKTNSVP